MFYACRLFIVGMIVKRIALCEFGEFAYGQHEVSPVYQISLKKGEKVTLVGFGTFERRQRAARTGRNPQTGKEIKIAAKKVPAFSAGKKFKELVK